MSDAKAQRRYRATERGRQGTRVRSLATQQAVKWVREHHPQVWRRILDDAWRTVTGDDPRPLGRPPR